MNPLFLLEAIKLKNFDLLNKSFPIEKKLSEVDQVQLSNITEDILIFSVGGWTYEEAHSIYRFNRENQGNFRVTLAGTSCLNSHSFIEDVSRIISG